MSGDVLRRAARLMRERAEAAKAESINQGLNWWGVEGISKAFYALSEVKNYPITGIAEDAEHIASWHPAAAPAVADWLEHTAAMFRGNDAALSIHPALAVARAYLGADQ